MRWSEDVVVFEGDSLTYLGRMQDRMENLLDSSSVHNVATGGNTIQHITAQASSEVDSLYDGSGSNRLFLWIGVNNLLDGSTSTPQSVLDDVWAYVDARTALGWEVTILTLPQSDGMSNASKVLEYNQLMREQWHIHADEIIDVAADPRFQNSTDETYFNTDQLHLTTEGSEAIADLVDALYMPARMLKQAVAYYDLGQISFDTYHGSDAIISTGGTYAGGGAITGAFWYDVDGTAHRITYNDLGTHERLDLDGDGSTDLLSLDGTYSNGDDLGSVVWYDLDGTMQRITYNNLGDYKTADLDGDGDLEIFSNNGTYSSGASLNGAVWYDLDGTMHRLSYFDLGEYRVADWDGDGTMEVISSMGSYLGGGSLGGVMIVETDGSASRLNYFDAGTDYELLDLDGDGDLEIFSPNAAYNSGAAINGTVYFDQSGAINRFSYNTLGDYTAADVTGDGDLEIISTGDTYSTGASVGGTMLYDSDGTATRLNYYEMDEYHLFDFDNDGQLELITGSARYNSGSEISGLLLFELTGDTYNFQRIGYGDFDNYHIADLNGDGWLDVANQTAESLIVHYYMQEVLF